MSNPSQALPSGTVTFLFTDIEGSTQLWEKYPEAMKAALAKHDAILKDVVEANNGHVLKSTGDGIHAVFETAAHGVAATIVAQKTLSRNAWEEIKPEALRVRMGLHTGEAELRNADYFGGTLNRAARIMAAGHGGQVLLSGSTAELVRGQLSGDITLIDLGEHHLKGLLQAEHIFQISAPDLTREFPSLNSLSAPIHNLPAQLTTFIGREHELSETKEKLDTTRLLTLIGPGGTGKTRLALQLAANQLDRFKDGVWLVELAPIVDAAFIVSTIADVFQLREAQGIPLITLLIDYLRAKELLLVLDNCEHLVEASAHVADQLLHSCGKLKIIASSREALGIDGETVYRVPSLSLPDPDSNDLMKYEATKLFVDRATKAEPRFKATKENAAAITQICKRLDGIPLAIELAAARVKLFTPEQISERLDDRFKLLSGGSRSALPRQQTLRALIDWSYHSLNDIEQRALRRLAVFSGGWTIDGAEAVVNEAEAVDGLLGLVNKSLVNVDEQSGAARYRFLETIRQYAMEKLLDTDEAVETRNRHVDYVLNLTGDAELGASESVRLPWLEKMEVEHDNLRAALEWSTSNNLLKAIELAAALGDFWTVRDYNREAEAWCQPILARSEELTTLAAARSRLYAILAQAAIFAGDHKLARTAATAGLILAKQVPDKSALVRLYTLVGLSSFYLGDFPACQQALESAEALAREMDSKADLVMVLVLKAQSFFYANGDTAESKAVVKTNLDEIESFKVKEFTHWSNAMNFFLLARLSGLLGDIEKARGLYNQSVELARKTGNLRLVYASHSELAHILRRQGEIDEALALYAEVLPKWKELGHRAAVAHELECVAFILLKKAQTDRTLTLLAAADALRAEIDSTMTKLEQADYDQVISTLHAQVDEKNINSYGRSVTR